MAAVRKRFYGLLLLLLCWGLPGRGQAPASAAAPPLEGLWKGPLKIPGGQLEVIFRLVQLTGGEYFATLDVPLQKVSHLAVTVTTHADTVTFVSEEANSRYVGRLAPGGKRLEGTWQQPGLKVPMVLEHSALPVVAAAPISKRLTPPYREEDVTFANSKASVQLVGTLTVPAGPGPFPAAVLLSDTGPQDRNGTVGDYSPLGALADYLTRRGVAVLRFDDRGVGHSTGSAGQALPTELVGDAQAALNYLRTRPEVNQTRLGLIGHGEGANVALLAAAQPLPPSFVVGLAPYGLPGSEVALQQQEVTLRALQTDPKLIAAIIKRQQSMFDVINHTPVNAQAQTIVANMLRQNNAALDQATAQANAAAMVTPRYRFLLGFNPADDLPQVTCPTLLLFGAADTILNPDENSAALVKGLKNNKAVTTRKLPGVNHLFQADPKQWPLVSGEPRPTFSPAAEEAIRAWVTSSVSE